MGKKTERLLENARGHLAEKDYDNALRLLNQVLNREPGHPSALKNKAFIINRTGSREDAEKFLRLAVEQCRDDELYQMLGALCLEKGKPEKGRRWLQQAVEINSNSAEAHYGLGIYYASHEQDHGKAVEHFSKTLQVNPVHTGALFNRGCSHMIRQRMKRAESDFLKAESGGDEKAGEMLDSYFRDG